MNVLFVMRIFGGLLPEKALALGEEMFLECITDTDGSASASECSFSFDLRLECRRELRWEWTASRTNLFKDNIIGVLFKLEFEECSSTIRILECNRGLVVSKLERTKGESRWTM